MRAEVHMITDMLTLLAIPPSTPVAVLGDTNAHHAACAVDIATFLPHRAKTLLETGMQVVPVHPAATCWYCGLLFEDSPYA